MKMPAIILFICMLLIISSGTVIANDGSSSSGTRVVDGKAVCEDGFRDPYNIYFVSSTYHSSSQEITCRYQCGFRWSDPFNTGETSTPLNSIIEKTVSAGASVTLTYNEMQRYCCGTQQGICFFGGFCYYRPGGTDSCTTGEASAGTSCTCSIEYYDQGTNQFIKVEENECGKCSPAQCPPGQYLVHSSPPDDIKCCPDGLQYVNGDCIDLPGVAPEVVQEGICGNEHQRVYPHDVNTFETDSFCLSGDVNGDSDETPSFPQPGHSVEWHCVGTGSTAERCLVSRNPSPIDAVCGRNAKDDYVHTQTSFLGQGATDFCLQGERDGGAPSFPNMGEDVDWVCKGLYGGSDATCTAIRASPPTVGECGDNRGTYSSEESDFPGRDDIDFCREGTPSINTDTFNFPGQGNQVSWVCIGLNDGANSQDCIASRSTQVIETPAECGPAARTYNPDQSSFTGALCSRGTVSGQHPSFPAEGENVFWECQSTDDRVICGATKLKPLVCRCNSVGRTQRDVKCEVFESGSSLVLKEVREMIDHGFDYPVIFSEKVSLDDGREADCIFTVTSGCHPEPGAPSNICPPNCKSHQHPDCDYGRYGLRLVDSIVNILNGLGLDLPTPQQWWNDVLSGTGFFGTVYSGIDKYFVGTPEWFTSLVCERGITIPDDDETCDLLGLPEGICGTEWDGYVNFQTDDVVLTLSADYHPRLGDTDRYRISWTMGNLEEGILYRVFLANIDNTLSYNDYNLLPQDKRFIFPVGDAYTEASSESIEYVSSIRYSDVCIEFYAGNPELLRELREILGVNGGAFTCRRIVYYN